MRIACLSILVAACSHSSTPGAPAGEPQSFRDGVQALCDLPDHVPDDGKPYDQRLAAVGKWANDHVTNADARKVGSLESLALDKEMLADAAKRAGITRCQLLDNGMALQSYADAMKVVCNAPHDDMPAYFKSHLLHPEVIRLFATLGDLNPNDRMQRVRDAVARAGIASCPGIAIADKARFEHAPAVTGAGFTEVGTGPMLVATPTGIIVDGKRIVAIANGDVDAADREGGAQGVVITRLREFLKQLAAAQHDTPRLELMIDPALTYGVMIEITISAKQAGFHKLGLVVRAGGDGKSIPFELPAPSPPSAAKPAAAALHMAVSVVHDRLVVWSLSGLEGSFKTPKATVKTAAELTPVLAEIVARRFASPPASGDRSVLITGERTTPMQTIAEIVAAVRTTPDGKDLFPDVLFGAGFE